MIRRASFRCAPSCFTKAERPEGGNMFILGGDEIQKKCDSLPPAQAVAFLQSLKNEDNGDAFHALTKLGRSVANMQDNIRFAGGLKRRNKPIVEEDAWETFLREELDYHQKRLAKERAGEAKILQTGRTSTEPGAGGNKDRKHRPGIENKTFIYADEINLKAHEYLINKPGIFQTALAYQKDATQFRRDLHNSKFVKYPLLEVRNRETGKSTAKMAIKRTRDTFDDSDRLIRKIENILGKQTSA